MAEIYFNAPNLVILYLKYLTFISDAWYKRKTNIVLGHIIAFILESKYIFQFSALLDHLQIFYSNSTFYVLHNAQHHNVRYVDDDPVEVKRGLAPALALVLTLTPFYQ